MASILIVDDEEGIREFLADTLVTDGHDITEVADGLAAVRVLDQRGFDLMITDLRMPGALDGIDLLRRARRDQPEMEVVVLTAHGTVDNAVEAMKLGAFDYLQKPLSSPAELRLLVARALERRRLLARDEVQRTSLSTPPLTYGDPVMTPVVKALEKVAGTNSTVLLLGESGTGKEVAARTIHERSARAQGPFVPVNCAAITDTLMESEIFGHEKGAFTGATQARRGRLELADGGTLFLDEIGELKPELQAKLLRVLQERRFERVGGSRTIDVDVRWIAATNRDLEGMVREGTFRDDLYHRLAVFPIELPPLRARHHDLRPLSDTLLARIGREVGRPELRLDDEARERIAQAPWPGNVRGLANALERAAIMAEGDTIRETDLRLADSPRTLSTGHTVSQPVTMEEVERSAIRDALDAVGGNRRRAAQRLGIGERTLYDKIKRYGLT
ncbi:sigma-54-dependent transcriptional regulator [Gaopeijia maritima]|uniref:Sigma-54 dependent transcriptional regulator n=1 Tax=Gaopeijia maritima TaxID=3119007 RepID=A0ABU9E6L6_9BACT